MRAGQTNSRPAAVVRSLSWRTFKFRISRPTRSCGTSPCLRPLRRRASCRSGWILAPRCRSIRPSSQRTGPPTRSSTVGSRGAISFSSSRDRAPLPGPVRSLPTTLTPKTGRPRRPPPLGALTDAERAELREIEAELAADGIARPRSRAECPPDDEACGFVSCRHNLFLDITRANHVRLRFPGKEIDELAQTCSLRVGPLETHEAARLLGVTHGAVRQIEVAALAKLRSGIERYRDKADDLSRPT